MNKNTTDQMVLLVTDHKRILRSAIMEKRIDSRNIDSLMIRSLQYLDKITKITLADRSLCANLQPLSSMQPVNCSR